MNKIKTRTLEDILTYKNTVILTYKLEYAEIISSDCENGKNIFNNYNKKKACELENYILNVLYPQAVELYEYNVANGYPIMVYEIDLVYTVTYNENCIVSLYYDEYQFTGGAHGNTIRTSQTWDLNTGNMLDLCYFFPNNPNYIVYILQNINTQMKEQIDSGQNYYFDNYCELVLETFKQENYYLTNEGIVIYFQQYDIAPYSSGILEFLIKIV